MARQPRCQLLRLLLLPAVAKPDDEEMPGVLAVLRLARQNQPAALLQPLAVGAHQPPPAALQLVKALQLDTADGGLEVGEVVFPARLADLVAPAARGGIAVPGVVREAVQAELADAPGQVVGIGGDHAALAGGEIFGGVERKNRDRADAADAAAAVAAAQGVGGVLDHAEVVAGGEAVDFVEAAGIAGDVHRHNRPGLRRDRPSDFSRIDIGAFLLHIDQDRAGAAVNDGLAGGRKGVGGGDHFIAAADAEGEQRQVQTGGA